MIKERIEPQMIKKEVEVASEYFCNACKKKIGEKIYYPEKLRSKDKKFYEITKTSYWSDELPLSEYLHACSGDCLKTILDGYIKDVEFGCDNVSLNIEVDYTNKDE